MRHLIEIKFADILREDVDAIVNPANRFMLHGGGLAAAIAWAGGKELVKESKSRAPIETGQSIATTAGELPFKAVIHTVGPVWEADDSSYWKRNSNEQDPDDLLAEAHRSAMEVAGQLEFTSLAFPAVSCGVFRFPVERAAPIAISSVREAQKRWPDIRVVFCLMSDDHFRAYSEAAG